MLLGALLSCGEPDDRPDESLGEAGTPLVPCLSTDETLSYPSSYVLTNPNLSPLVPNQDITDALQAAIDAQSATRSPTRPVIVIPQGTYYLSKTIRIRASWSIQIVGAVSSGGAIPVLKWNGAVDDDMFFVDWSWWTRFNRLVIDGNNTARIGLHFMESKQTFTMNAATNLMTTSYPVLDKTPMVPVDPGNPPPGLDGVTPYFMRKVGASYQLVTDPNCMGGSCVVDLVVDGPHDFVVGSGFNSYDHEITDVSFRSMKFGVVGGDQSMDYDDPAIPHPPCNIPDDGTEDARCIPLREDGLVDTGSDVSSVSIRRTTFSWITGQAVVVNTHNALDWGIYDSTFESSRLGVYVGAGQASIFNSRFRLNSKRDIELNTPWYVMIRDNTSLSSSQFLRAQWRSTPYSVSLVNNRVSTAQPPPPNDPVPALDLNNRRITLLDNVIMRGGSNTQPSIYFRDAQGDQPLDIVSGKNVASPALVFPSAPAARHLVVEANTSSSVAVAWPPAPPVAPWPNRTTVQVTANALGECCIGASCGECATLLVNPADGLAFHLKAGQYELKQPIVVPAGRNVLYYGDGIATKLVWTGTNASYVAPGSSGATVFFDLVGSSRASIREMSFGMNPDTPNAGYVGGVSIRSADDVGNRLMIGESKMMGGQKIGVDVDGFDKLATRIDMLLVGVSENAIRVKGKNAAQTGDSTLTKGVHAFSGEYTTTLADTFRVESYGKLVSQGADLEALAQGAVLAGSGYLTVAASRLVGGNAARVACVFGLTTPYPQHANYEIAPGFLGRATFLDVATTGRMVGAASQGKLLSLNVAYDYTYAKGTPAPGDVCPSTAPPESAVGYPAPTTCTGFGNEAAPDPGNCPFVSLDASAVAATRQAGINGHFFNELSGCHQGCRNQSNAAAPSFARSMLADLRAATSSPPQGQCGPTDVRLRRLVFGGRAVNASDWRMMEYGIRVR